MSKGMTREELADFVKETSVPLIKEQLGSDLAEIVRENVEKVASDPNGPWATKWSDRLVDQKAAAAPTREKGAAFGRVVRAMAAAKMNFLDESGVFVRVSIFILQLGNQFLDVQPTAVDFACSGMIVMYYTMIGSSLHFRNDMGRVRCLQFEADFGMRQGLEESLESPQLDIVETEVRLELLSPDDAVLANGSGPIAMTLVPAVVLQAICVVQLHSGADGIHPLAVVGDVVQVACLVYATISRYEESYAKPPSIKDFLG